MLSLVLRREGAFLGASGCVGDVRLQVRPDVRCGTHIPSHGGN